MTHSITTYTAGQIHQLSLARPSRETAMAARTIAAVVGCEPGDLAVEAHSQYDPSGQRVANTYIAFLPLPGQLLLVARIDGHPETGTVRPQNQDRWPELLDYARRLRAWEVDTPARVAAAKERAWAEARKRAEAEADQLQAEINARTEADWEAALAAANAEIDARNEEEQRREARLRRWKTDGDEFAQRALATVRYLPHLSMDDFRAEEARRVASARRPRLLSEVIEGVITKAELADMPADYQPA